jgi:hypothetical protein
VTLEYSSTCEHFFYFPQMRPAMIGASQFDGSPIGLDSCHHFGSQAGDYLIHFTGERYGHFGSFARLDGQAQTPGCLVQDIGIDRGRANPFFFPLPDQRDGTLVPECQMRQHCRYRPAGFQWDAKGIIGQAFDDLPEMRVFRGIILDYLFNTVHGILKGSLQSIMIMVLAGLSFF